MRPVCLLYPSTRVFHPHTSVQVRVSRTSHATSCCCTSDGPANEFVSSASCLVECVSVSVWESGCLVSSSAVACTTYHVRVYLRRSPGHLKHAGVSSVIASTIRVSSASYVRVSPMYEAEYAFSPHLPLALLRLVLRHMDLCCSASLRALLCIAVALRHPFERGQVPRRYESEYCRSAVCVVRRYGCTYRYVSCL